MRTLSRFCLWRRKQTIIVKVVRPPACAWWKGRLWQDNGRSFRSTGGAPQRTPATARRRPPEDETYGVWMVSDNSDRSSRCVENGGSKRRQEPRSVCVALGADRGSYQASRARNVRVTNPAGRPVEVSGVYGLCERFGRRRTKGVRGPYDK